MFERSGVERTRQEHSSALNGALTHAADGFHVVLLHGIVNGQCTCGKPCDSPGKHPRFTGWQRLATTDAATIRRWFAKHPASNYGVATGITIDALDVDPRHGGKLTHHRDGGVTITGPNGFRLEVPRTRIHQTGGGGWHAFVEHVAGVTGAELCGGGVELKSTGGLVVGPGSLHMSGERYSVFAAARITPPPVSLLSFRPDGGRRHGFEHTTYQTEGTSDRTANTTSRTSTGVPAGQSIPLGTRNRTLFRIACRYRHYGADVDTIIAGLLDANMRCSPSLPGAELQRIARSVVARYPAGPSTPRPTRPDRGGVAAIARAAANAEWRGLAGSTDRAVLEALLTIANAIGSPYLTASQRQLAEDAGVRHRTVSNSLRRLRGGGWLRQLANGHGTEASTWLLLLPPPMHKERPTSPQRGAGGLVGQSLCIGHDAFRVRGLGKNSRRILAMLTSGCFRALELKSAVGVHRNTVKNCLDKLADVGLVVEAPPGWWTAVEHRDLDAAAVAVGTAGKGAEQRREHAAERAQYRAELARRQQQRKPTTESTEDTYTLNPTRYDRTERPRMHARRRTRPNPRTETQHREEQRR